MGSASQAAALRNADKNYRMLKYARSNFNSDLYDRIHREYKLAKWSQLFLPFLIMIVMLVLCVFISSNETKLIIFAFGSIALIFILPIWIVICNLIICSKWKKYVKWYDSGNDDKEIVYNIFGMTNK